jgi:urease accessory protein
MIKLTRRTDTVVSVDTTLTLPLASRIKSRLRVTLDNGRDAGLFLERGSTLKDGEILRSEDGYTVRVKAAHETVSTICCRDCQLLARACYHLGNRHVLVQIEPDKVSYLQDHVLDDMLRRLGLQVVVTDAPFEPESGAYGGAAHGGGGPHGESHDHPH